MAHKNQLLIGQTALVVVDVQQAFRDVIPDLALMVSRIVTAVQGFQILGVPVIVTEQYPKGLGNTVEEIQRVLINQNSPIEKTTFSGAAPVIEKLKEMQVSQVVLCGLETHICVNQTAHDLLEGGFQVHILTDCVASRSDHNRAAGLAKMSRSGVIECSTEMALFELMRDAKHDKFKEIQALIK
ncbi:MAG: isochorismatase family protein [Pyrinomonadaceae bacterium]